MFKKITTLVWILILTGVTSCSKEEHNITSDNAEADKQLLSISKGQMLPGFVSRTSGVAPLNVQFTSGFTASDESNRSATFHDNEYSWNFGDDSSASWETTGKSKNKAKGPIAAHIFETPGNYTVTLTARNNGDIIGTETFNITVEDPDLVYSGAKTIYVSTGTDFTGLPAEAIKVTTTNLSSIMQYIKPGTRVLLRKGDSWRSSGLNFPNIEGPVTIGAYGSGAKPKITMTGGNFMSLAGKQDWRIMDLHLLDAANGVHEAILGAIDMQRITMHRLDIEGFRITISISVWNSRKLLTNEDISITECHLSGSNVNVVYAGGEQLNIQGNVIKNPRISHVMRVWQGYRSVISHNIISGSSLMSNGGRQALKLHSPTESLIVETPTPGTGMVRHATEFIVVSDNVFGNSGPWPVGIGPENNSSDNRVTDVVFERNRFISDYGEASSRPVQVALHVWARYVSVRNNIFDGTGSSSSYDAVKITQWGIEPSPLGVHVYNNTIYRADNASGYPRKAFVVASVARETRIVNNLVSFPESGMTNVLIQNASPDLVESNNLLTNTPGFIAPNGAPLSRNFNLLPASPAINQGINVPVLEDFNENPRPVLEYDLGAFEYQGN